MILAVTVLGRIAATAGVGVGVGFLFTLAWLLAQGDQWEDLMAEIAGWAYIVSIVILLICAFLAIWGVS